MPPAALWLLAGREGAAHDRAGLIVYVALTQAAAAILAASAGVLDVSVLRHVAWLAPLHIAGTFVGAHLFRRVPDTLVRPGAIVIVILLGAATALR